MMRSCDVMTQSIEPLLADTESGSDTSLRPTKTI